MSYFPFSPQSAWQRIKPWLRPVYHALRSAAFYFRARKIASYYAVHYAEAKRLYVQDGHPGFPLVSSLADVRVRVSVPGAPDNLIRLPEGYTAVIARIHHSASERFEDPSQCLFFPKVAGRISVERTGEIPAVKNGEVIAIQLKEYLDIDGLQDLCPLVLPEIEQSIYRSYVIVEKVYVYRNLVSRREEQVSWMWHYDNHPAEILKVMIYLTEVKEQNGPLEFIRSSQTHEALKKVPTPLTGYGRVSPSTVERYLSAGYECQKVTGPRGTLILFDDNIIHKANIPQSGYRDAVVLQIRPSTFRPKTYIDLQWTGSFQHVDFNADPYDYQPRPKSRMLSG